MTFLFIAILLLISSIQVLGQFFPCPPVDLDKFGNPILSIGGDPATLAGLEHTLQYIPESQVSTIPHFGGYELGSHTMVYAARGTGAGSGVFFTAITRRNGHIAVLRTINQGHYNIVYKVRNKGQEIWYYSVGECGIPFEGDARDAFKAQSIKLAHK